MSSDLPPVPSLEHLKKQAKALLSERRKTDAAAKLADAQRLVALEYGFASWAKMKKRVEAAAAEAAGPIEQLKYAFNANDFAAVAKLLERHPPLAAGINEPTFDFDSPPIVVAAQRGRREMIDVLLRFGADINARSKWWAGGFGALDWADADLAAFLIARGARVDIHAAAHLGMLDKIVEIVSADPAAVGARGGDGKTPLHCASTVEVAAFLLDHGADIDARDIDHESTPAQYLVGEYQQVLRYLVSRGCKTDILMAAALGDAELVNRCLYADAESIRMRVSEEYFPLAEAKAGGTIYQWTLGWFVSAHQVATRYKHEDIFELLMARTPAEEKLLVACWAGDAELVGGLLKEQSNLAAKLPAPGKRMAAHAAHNNNTPAVRLMLSAGLPVDARGRHGGAPLHWAAFHGNLEMARDVLRYQPPLEQADEQFKATPLGWAIYGSEHGWNRKAGDYAGVVRLLNEAGAALPDKVAGSEAVREELLRAEREMTR